MAFGREKPPLEVLNVLLQCLPGGVSRFREHARLVPLVVKVRHLVHLRLALLDLVDEVAETADDLPELPTGDRDVVSER